jgi:hypothetical protein
MLMLTALPKLLPALWLKTNASSVCMILTALVPLLLAPQPNNHVLNA